MLSSASFGAAVPVLSGKQLRVLVVGATGRTGRLVVDGVLERGWRATALVRDPGDHPLLWGTAVALAAGNLLQAASLGPALVDQDAVVCAFGPTSGAPGDLCSRGTRNLIAAMEGAGVKRLICVTGALVGSPKENLGGFYRLLRLCIPSASLADRRLQELAVQHSSLDWTLVRPPRLTLGPVRRSRHGEHLALSMGSSISRGSLAAFVLDGVAQSWLFRRAVTVVD